MKAEEALECLQEGNARFRAQANLHPRADARRMAETATHGQHPIAVMLSCSDSRVPVELIFDQGIGDLFVVRVAGNVCGAVEVASIEYALDHLATPLVVVVGHTRCGAVTAVTTSQELGRNLRVLADHIRPAVNRVRRTCPDLHGDALVSEVVEANVWQSIEDLFRESSVTRRRIQERKLKVVGAIYDVAAGSVDWLGEHPHRQELMGP